MPRPRLRLAAGLPTLPVGAALDYMLRRPGASPDYNIGVRHAPDFALDHPIASPSHRSETIELLQMARRPD